MSDDKPHPAAAYLVEALAEMARSVASAKSGNAPAAAAHAKAAATWSAAAVVASVSLAAAEAAAGPGAPFIREAFRALVDRGMAEHHASLRADDRVN